jgi:hypothetical protein
MACTRHQCVPPPEQARYHQAGFTQSRGGAASAAAVAAALAAHLSSVPWMSKDLVWLLPDALCGVQPSMQACAPLEPNHSRFTYSAVAIRAMRSVAYASETI